MKIRAHNLLCIQGFVGKGYSPEFIANMTQVIESLGDATPVTVIDEPDVLCAACPNLAESGCTLHSQDSADYPDSEGAIARQDRDVMERLGLAAGETSEWNEIVGRIASQVAPDDLDDICGQCPWLPLGVCKAGLEALRK